MRTRCSIPRGGSCSPVPPRAILLSLVEPGRRRRRSSSSSSPFAPPPPCSSGRRSSSSTSSSWQQDCVLFFDDHFFSSSAKSSLSCLQLWGGGDSHFNRVFAAAAADLPASSSSWRRYGCSSFGEPILILPWSDDAQGSMLLAAYRLDCSHGDPCDRRKKKLEMLCQLLLSSNNNPVCYFLPEPTAMVQNFMTWDTWTGPVDETVSVHNHSDPSVGDSKRAHAKFCHEAASSFPESCLFFPFSFAGHGFPVQASKTVVVPDEERTTSFFSKNSLQSSLAVQIVRILDCCRTWVVWNFAQNHLFRRLSKFSCTDLSVAFVSVSLRCLYVCLCVCVLHQNLCPAASILISRIVEA